MLKKVSVIFVILSVLIFSTGCSDILPEILGEPPAGGDRTNEDQETDAEDDDPGTSGDGFVIYPGYVEIAEGDSIKVALLPKPKGKIKWSSSDEDVAAVDSDGTITAVSEGDAVIWAALSGDSSEEASCSVHVKEDGPTYIYRYEPDEPDDTDDPGSGPGGGGFGGGDDDSGDDDDSDGDDGSDDGDDSEDGDEGSDEGAEGEDNTPTEYDGSIPIEVIPELDEFVWTLKIDDTDEFPISDFGVYAKCHLKLNCVKDGGKNCFGKYKCTGTWTVEFPNEELSELLSDSGITYESNLSNTLVVKEFTMTLQKYDFNKLYPDPDEKRVNVPGMTAMAMGEMDLIFSQQGGATISDEHESKFVDGSFAAVPTSLSYKLRISSNGKATMEVKGQDGTLLAYFGQLSRKPKRPD